MSSVIPISVFIITQNEEKHIRRLLLSCQGFDEIIIVDSGSTDNTLSIAKEFGVSIFHRDWMGYAKQKSYAMSLCRNKWVLNLDADEELTSELIKSFKEAIKQDKYNSVRCQRNDVFLGKPLSRFTKMPNNCRLYKKDFATFDSSRLAHERADVQGMEQKIPQHFNHYGYSDIETITYKNNLYSSLKAKEKYLKNKKPSKIKLLLVFPLIFFKTYIIQRHVLSGYRGFILSISTAYYLFIKEVKLFEISELNASNKNTRN